MSSDVKLGADLPSGPSLVRRASLHFQLLLSLSTKVLSISQLLLWGGGKSGFWQTGCSEWQFLDFGQVSYIQAPLLDTYYPDPCFLLLLSVWLCKFPCCHIPSRPQALVLRLTGHGFKAQHAAHKVREANSPGSITVPQGHQTQKLFVSGQTCRGKRNDSTGDTLLDGGVALTVLCTLWRSWDSPSGPPPCHAGSHHPWTATWVHKTKGWVMENQSPSSQSVTRIVD